MGRKRTFDWAKAAKLRKQGLTVVQTANELGVSPHAVYYATDPAYRERSKQAVKHHVQTHSRVPCLGGCGRTVYNHYRDSREITGFCYRCWNDRRLADREPQHGTESEYTRHKCRCDLCRQAANQARNRRRQAA